jgi:CheY-like chemotaxis protein
MKPVHILLAEDDPIAAYITQDALEHAPFAYTLAVVSDGEQALHYLRKEGPFSGVPTVDLLLLDLNMPNKDGLEVLKDLRADARLRQTPVMVLTTSSAQRDRDATFAADVSCYVTKPFDPEQLRKAIEIIKPSLSKD